MDQQRKLRATNNYMFSVDDLIGKGATCEVYKGIHKVTGEVHALKVFEKRLQFVAEREIEALKSLKHENIVDFIGKEHEVDSGKVVAVMEYCDKSLYAALLEPHNKYGLPEEEFVRFFKHTVEGMKHLRENGFLHRDIKPGNILIGQEDDGSNVYKLSDFGTAKPVLETEAFQSLVGTEEYLHPKIFSAAFIDRGVQREFDAAADLWSLGATLYHTATGSVPFMPYQGRSDKIVMFQMIAQKEFGVIAGEQKSARGDVIWHRELPDSCKMSRWLKDAMTDVLKRLMESDPRKAMTFESFFVAADDILTRRIVYVFNTSTARHFRLYMKPDCVFADVQDEINIETNIPPKTQLIHYEECLLRDIISDVDPLAVYPKMSGATPLVLIRSTDVQQCVMPNEKRCWYHETLFLTQPLFPSDVKYLDEDYRTVKSVCETIALVKSQIKLGCLTQVLFEKTITRTERWKEILVSRLQTEVELYRCRIKDLLHIHTAISKCEDKPCLILQQGVSVDELKMRINSCSGLVKKIREFVTEDNDELFNNSCVDGNNCEKKVERLLQQAMEKKTVFDGRRRKRSVLAYHEERLHKFDRQQVLNLYNKTANLWKGHCEKKVTEIHNHFLNWHKKFAELQTVIETLQRDMRGLKSAIKKYMRQFKVASTDSMSTMSTMTSDDSLVSASMAGDASPTNITPFQHPTLNTDRRKLTKRLNMNLDKVKSGQAELKRMVSESEDIQAQTLAMMSLEDMAFVTLPESE